MLIQSAAVFPSEPVDLQAAVLQGVITLGVALGGLYGYRRYRKPYLAWFAVTLWLYAARIGIIAAFLSTQSPSWLYWHQVATGWTGLALLWTALTFERERRFRFAHLAAFLFPIAWSYIAVYQLDSFLAAALPAVVFLSAVTAGTAWVFGRYARRAGSSAALFLAATLALWAVHHLDYPFLRARGVWSPWGYYIDIVLVLVTSAGLGALVLEDLQRGVNALVALAPSTRRGEDDSDELGLLLSEALKLPAALGSALVLVTDGKVGVIRAAGALERWTRDGIPDAAARDIASTVHLARPRVINDWTTQRDTNHSFPFAALLPIALEHAAPAALVLVGEARHPFAALDEPFLVALGRQIGGAMQSRALVDRLRARTDELARLATRTIGLQEEERRRLSLELHDETAQVFAAVKLRLGLLREQADPALGNQLGQLVELVDTGMRSIRSVTESLRPTVLDELGIAAALRSLVMDFTERTNISVQLTGVEGDFRLPAEVELALYRAVQEALANVARHTGAKTVKVDVQRRRTSIAVSVRDDGAGFPAELDAGRLVLNGHAGLAGMRERVGSLGGRVSLGRSPEGGAQVAVELPLHE